RPHVKAAERFHRWHSHFGVMRDMQNASTLPARARRARFDTIIQSVEPKTRETYSAGLARFHEFCDAQRVPEEKRMPASDFLLSAFVAHHAGRVGKSCVDNWLAGLQLWHNLHDAPWLGNRALTAAAKGVHKLAPASSSRARRAPVTVEHMRRLGEHLDLADSFDAAVYAAAAVAFRGCCRLGELVVLSAATYDATRHVGRGCVIERGTSVSGVHFRRVRLPWSKTSGAAGADVILSASRDGVCPVTALDNHLAVNSGAPLDVPLFAWKDRHGSWCPLTRSWLLKRCSAVWSACGMATVHGHSFRIGGATDLLLRGVQPAVVAVQGRWKSRAFLQYWRNVESVIPDFIDRA
ncbi:DNA breaking-rejoining enzyme, partial [Exidia glandulosa HHB12029]